MNKKQSTAKGFTVLSAAGIINKVLALAYVTLQTWLVGDLGNGIINAGYRIYIFVFTLSNAGIPVAIAKLVSAETAVENYKDSRKILKTAYFMMAALGMLFCIITAAFSYPIACAIGQPRAHYTILFLAPTMLFTSISSAIRGYFQGRSNMMPTAMSQIIEQALNSILTIVFIAIFLKTYGTLEMAAAGSTIGTSIGALGAAIFLMYTYFKNRREFSLEIKNSTYTGPHMTTKQIFRDIIIFGLPIILGTVALNASDLIDAALVVNRLIAGGFSKDAASSFFGILSTQYQRVLNLPLAITATLPAALVPALSYAAAIKDNKLMARKINESFKAIFIIIIPSAVGFAILPKQITALIFFSLTKYNSRPDLMTIGSWVIILNAIIYIQNSALIGIGKTYISPINLTIGLIFKVVLGYTLISVHSVNLRGAIIATTAGYLVASLLNHIKMKQYLPYVKIDYKRFIMKPLVASISMAIVALASFYSINFVLLKILPSALLSNDIALLIAIFLGMLTYGFVLIYFRGIKSNDIARLPLGKKLNNFLNRIPVLRKRLA